MAHSTSSNTKRFNCRLFMKEVLYGFLTEYETPKIVMIHSYAITSLLRIIQIALFLYCVFYLLVYQKGYQKQDTSIISSVTLKVKGIGYIHTPDNQTYVFDGTDYIVPPSENNAIFIMTNFIQTDQSRSQCSESMSIREAKCTTDDDCQNRPYMTHINGRWTGRCLMPTNLTMSNLTRIIPGSCELQGWCPVEDDLQKSTPIREILNFTIFIKNFVEFPAFNVKHKNMAEKLKTCIYDPTDNDECPIFRLDYIINAAEKNLTERDVMLLTGGVIRIKLDWDCNLDRSIKLCKPVYSFARLDTPSYEETFSVGFNFRFASYWKRNKKYLRSLTKAYGLRFIISVSGKAGKFDFITLTLNTGSLVGIFGLATFFCDLILLNLTRKASMYRDLVYQRVYLDELHRQNSAQNLKDAHKTRSTVYENPSVHLEKISSNHRTSRSIGRTSDSLNTPLSSVPLDSNQLLRLQPNLGLTNIIN